MDKETCIHQRLCKHFQEDEIATCEIREVCKYFAASFLNAGIDIDGVRQEVKMPKSGRKAAVSSEQAILHTFRKAKIYISLNRKKLDENQKKAVESLSGKHYSGLTKEQKDQIIEIAADLERTIKG
jgi:hypothetical protein